MAVCAADGMLVNLADTPAKPGDVRLHGHRGAGRRRGRPVSAAADRGADRRAGRATLGAILGSTQAGEQTLMKRLVKRRPDLFAGRVTCFDRNFPGHELISAILDAGGHVVARVSATVALPLEPGGGWLPDGSRLTWLNAPSGKKQDRLPVRAAEHNVVLPDGDGQEEVSETCTVITTVLDHQAAPAGAVRETYLTRWSASETTFGEDKTTITGAGNRTSGPVLRSGSPRLVIQEAWAWLAGTQLVRASAAAALRTGAAAARALRREDSAPVTADEESFTAVWRHAIRSMTSSQLTATSSLEAIAAAGDAAARAALHTLNVPGRQRHSKRAQKAGLAEISARHRDQADRYRETADHRIRARLLLSCGRSRNPPGRRNRPGRRGPGPWNRAPSPPRHAGQNHARTPAAAPRNQTQRPTRSTRAVTTRNAANT